MSQTEATELLAAVQGFLRQSVLPQLEGFDAYTTRVAANSLAIVTREIAARGLLDVLDRAAAARWLPGSPVTEQPVRALSLALRDGSLRPDADFVSYLRQRTLSQMAIDNPRYSAFKQARQRWPETAALVSERGPRA